MKIGIFAEGLQVLVVWNMRRPSCLEGWFLDYIFIRMASVRIFRTSFFDWGSKKWFFLLPSCRLLFVDDEKSRSNQHSLHVEILFINNQFSRTIFFYSRSCLAYIQQENARYKSKTSFSWSKFPSGINPLFKISEREKMEPAQICPRKRNCQL
jgi:hypothetical protein